MEGEKEETNKKEEKMVKEKQEKEGKRGRKAEIKKKHGANTRE